MPLHQTCQLTLWNFIRQDWYIVNTTHMPAGLVPLHVESCYVAACWPSATPCRELLYRCIYNIYVCWPQHRCCSNIPTGWVLLQDGCLLDCCHSISMPVDRLSLNIACLLVMCCSICYTFWLGVSPSAVPADMVSHYQPCLLVWCLIIGHAFWFGISLSAMPVGVVPHYRPCLLGWCLIVGHVFWCGASL